MRRRSIMKTRPRKRHMLSTCSVRNVPKKLGASSRRYMLPGSVDTHSKKPWNGGGHISRLDSRHAAFFDADLRAADAAVGPVLVVAIRAGFGQLVAQLVHGVLILRFRGVVDFHPSRSQCLRELDEIGLGERHGDVIGAFASGKKN